MIIKRFTNGAFVELHPKTTTQRLFNTAGTIPVFDSQDKINLNFLPNAVFDSLYFRSTAGTSETRTRAALAFGDSLTIARSLIGYYFVASQAISLLPQNSALATVFQRTFVVTQGSALISAAAGNNTNNLSVGMVLVGTGIPTGTTILSISGGSITMSNDATAGSFTSVVVSFQRFFQTSISFGEEINIFQRQFTLTNGSSTVTTGDTTQLEVGMNVTGASAGIPTGAKIQTILNATSFTLSANATTSNTQNLTFQFGINPPSVQLEAGDWFVITDFTGLGTSASPFLVTFGVINNTYEIMSGAGATTAGAPGLVPAPAAGQHLHFLRGDGQFAIPIDTNTEYFGSTSILLNTDGGVNTFQRAALTGDVTAAANSNSTIIENNAVTTIKINNDAVNFDKLLNSATAGLSVIGRNVNSAGSFGEIRAQINGHVLTKISATELGFGQVQLDGIADLAVGTGKIANDAVDNTKLANMTAFKIKGNNTNAAADPKDLTALELRLMSNLQSVLFGETLPNPGTNTNLQNTPINKSNGMADGSGIPAGTIWFDTTTA